MCAVLCSFLILYEASEDPEEQALQQDIAAENESTNDVAKLSLKEIRAQSANTLEATTRVLLDRTNQLVLRMVVGFELIGFWLYKLFLLVDAQGMEATVQYCAWV
jgi:hypothetical protein